MMFRLQCSADRQGQLYNLHTALIFDQDETAARDGLVTNLARLGMRKLSQKVFSLFKRSYIDLSSVRLKSEQIQLLSAVRWFGCVSIGLQGA